jgi:hypothetical protein
MTVPRGAAILRKQIRVPIGIRIDEEYPASKRQGLHRIRSREDAGLRLNKRSTERQTSEGPKQEAGLKKGSVAHAEHELIRAEGEVCSFLQMLNQPPM